MASQIDHTLQQYLDAMFDPASGWLAQHGYRQCQQQRDYANACLKVILEGHGARPAWHSAGEGKGDYQARYAPVGALRAGTGIGKTLAYMVVLAGYVAATGERVMISTFTLHLLRQILSGRDTRIALEGAERHFKLDRGIVLRPRYGRRNFVDLLRIRKLCDKLQAEGKTIPGEFLAWAEQSCAAPDTDAIPGGLFQSYTDTFGQLPGHLNQDAVCLPDDDLEPDDLDARNPNYRAHVRDSQYADILVTSHAMAIINAKRANRLLDPEPDEEDSRRISVLVADEADRLPDAAKSLTERRIQPRIIARHAGTLANTVGDVKRANQLKHCCDDLDAMLTEFVDEYQDRENRFVLIDELDDADRRRLAAGLKSLDAGLSALLKVCGDATSSARETRALATLRQYRRDLEGLQDSLVDIRGDGNGAAAGGADNIPVGYFAISWSPVQAEPCFVAGEFEPARILRNCWNTLLCGDERQGTDGRTHRSETWLRAAILTSATLPGSAGAVAAEYGIRRGMLRMEHLPFEPTLFGSMQFVRCDAANGIPQPDYITDAVTGVGDVNPEWIAFAARALAQIPDAMRPCLALVSSYDVAEQIQTAMEHDGTDQGVVFHPRGTRIAEVVDETFHKGGGSMLVTPAGWEGVNIVGPGGAQLLRSVVIAKLPFPPPDPVHDSAFTRRTVAWLRASPNYRGDSAANVEKVAREKAKNTLWKRSSHRGAAKFAQGIGRGVRGHDHLITAYILDARFESKRWGTEFSSLIPGRFKQALENPVARIDVSGAARSGTAPPHRKRSPRRLRRKP